jgi:hypothetical protein
MKTILLAAVVTAPLASQTIAEGYADALRTLPANAGNVLLLRGDRTVYFTGTDLVLDAPPAPPRPLLSFASPRFGSFTTEVGPDLLLFGENSTGEVWAVPVSASGTARLLATLPFNYDATAFGPGLAIVSAKTGGFGAADNDIVLLHLDSGAAHVVAQVPGASGAVAVDDNLDLVYATAPANFPPPPGSVSILRFGRAALITAARTGVPLHAAQATILFAGLDAAGDLALDADGDLLFVDWLQNEIGELNDLYGGSPWRTDFASYPGPLAPGTLQFLDGRVANGAQFEPFQPGGGLELVVHETDFASQSQLRTVRPCRAMTGATGPSPIPTGMFDVVTTAGPANGLGLVAITPPPAPVEVPLAIGGFEMPLFWNLASTQAVNTHFVTFDAGGRAVLRLVNPGFPLGVLAGAQVAFIAASGGALGSSGACTLLLGQ